MGRLFMTSTRNCFLRLPAILSIVALLCSGCFDFDLGLNGDPASKQNGGAPTSEDDGPPAADEDDGPPAADENDDEAEAALPPSEGEAPDDEAPDDPADAPPAAPDEPSSPDTGTDPPPSSVSTGSYGAGKTGPSAEACDTTGTRVSSIAAISGSGTFLLSGGSYGALSVPEGGTVKPYNCEQVTINGTVSLGNGATVAGLTVKSDAKWVIRIGGRDITVRNSTINGGSIEAIRVFDNANNVDLVGNNIDGGRNNHTVKVIAESGSAHPADIRIHNNRFTKRYYGTASEDLLQLEGHKDVVVTNNTFENNPSGEDGLDVKQGTDGILVEHNDFNGSTIQHECLMVAGGYARNIIRDNQFSDCKAISLGAGYDTWPWWRFEANHLRDSQLRLRQSRDAEVIGNDMVGGQLTLGIPTENDNPRNLTLIDNRFSGVWIDNNLIYSYTCANNVLDGVSGSSLDC
jgi:hypothetical protein